MRHAFARVLKPCPSSNDVPERGGGLQVERDEWDHGHKREPPMRGCRTLLISDDLPGLGAIGDLFPQDGELSQIAYSAQSVRAALDGTFDLVLLDCRVEPQRGIQICRGLRALEEMASIPILALTPTEDGPTRVSALEAGADDCVTDSLSPREFALRLELAVRRTWIGEGGRRLNYADIELDLERYRVRRRGASIHLPAVQFRLLRHFLENPTVVYSRRELLEQVWNDTSIDERSVNVAIVRLRRAINSTGGPNLIRCVPGLGYALDVDA